MNFQVIKRLMIATNQTVQAILEVERQYIEAQKWLKKESEAKENASDEE